MNLLHSYVCCSWHLVSVFRRYKVQALRPCAAQGFNGFAVPLEKVTLRRPGTSWQQQISAFLWYKAALAGHNLALRAEVIHCLVMLTCNGIGLTTNSVGQEQVLKVPPLQFLRPVNEAVHVSQHTLRNL